MFDIFISTNDPDKKSWCPTNAKVEYNMVNNNNIMLPGLSWFLAQFIASGNINVTAIVASKMENLVITPNEIFDEKRKSMIYRNKSNRLIPLTFKFFAGITLLSHKAKSIYNI